MSTSYSVLKRQKIVRKLNVISGMFSLFTEYTKPVRCVYVVRYSKIDTLDKSEMSLEDAQFRFRIMV